MQGRGGNLSVFLIILLDILKANKKRETEVRFPEEKS